MDNVNKWHSNMYSIVFYVVHVTQTCSQTFLWGGVQLVKIWDFLWLRAENLVSALDLAILGRGCQMAPPAMGLSVSLQRNCKIFQDFHGFQLVH